MVKIVEKGRERKGYKNELGRKKVAKYLMTP